MRKALIAEAVGTFCLVFVGTGAIVVNQLSQGAISHLGIAASFGLVVMVLIYAFGDHSGAHFNPAVSIAFWLNKRFPGSSVFPYMLAQLIGAFCASLSIKALFPNAISLGETIPSGSIIQSFMLEGFLTLFLIVVILNVTSGSKEKGLLAGIAIGATVGLEALFAGPISGASMNPVRSIAPAIVGANMETIWIYIAAPTIAAFLSVPLLKTLR